MLPIGNDEALSLVVVLNLRGDSVYERLEAVLISI
jgi:hypothetical protein